MAFLTNENKSFAKNLSEIIIYYFCIKSVLPILLLFQKVDKNKKSRQQKFIKLMKI
jgi:hypothetical protein